MARFLEIQTALDSRLASLAGLPPVAWPNTKYEPAEGTSWIRPSNLPSDASAVGMENTSTVRTLGFYQIDIFTPADGGPAAALTLADQIAGHFPKGLQLTSGDSVAVLGVPAQDPAAPSGAWFRVAVLIPYDVFT
jgi:hypothetical protein